jgi:protein O-GlcNAc transferase
MSLNVNRILTKAKSLSRKGDLAEAAKLFQSVLKRFPENQRAKTGLASLGQAGTQSKTPTSQVPREQILHAVRLYQTGQLSIALAQSTELASAFPEDPVIRNLIGVINARIGNTQAAIKSYTSAIMLNPNYAEAYFNAGVAYQNLSNTAEAIEHYSRASQLEPKYAEAYSGLGTALKMMGRVVEAVASFNRAIELQPDSALAHNNLANALLLLGRKDEAIAHFIRSVQLAPSNAESHYNLGLIYEKEKQLVEAMTCYEKALHYRPDFEAAKARILNLNALHCNWDASLPDAGQISTLGTSNETVSPFVMLSMEDDPASHHRRSVLYASLYFKNYQELPAFYPPNTMPDRLHIGYFSADFHYHATMFLMIKLFELHHRDRFVIHAYSYGPKHDDTMSKRLQRGVDVFHDVSQMSEREIAELARSEEIDIAVDLKGYTEDARSGIFAYRAAPIQISYLGYPGTLGMPTMDYILADKTVIPEHHQSHYSEKVIYLPDSYQVNDSEREISEHGPSRTEAGLPEQGFVFCCFNNSYKISPREFDIWMRLLNRVEGSVLWLFGSNEIAADNLKVQARKRGVNPERIVIAKKESLPEHLARHKHADLFLDTFNYNAHTTASDALWAGVPVVTRLGQGFAARVGASLLTAMGLPELITHSEAEYEQLALELALNPDRLNELRGRLENNHLSSPLFDTALFRSNIESAFEQAYQKHLEGKSPESFSVDPVRA